MSFFTSNRTDRCPGPITGNPLNGLCERVCIQTTKVFDSGMRQFQLQNATVTVTNLTPADPVQPLTFVSCTSTSLPVTVTNLVVDRFEDRPCFARISADVNIPIRLVYTDANGIEGEGDAVITVSEDVIMYVPEPSIIPFRIEAFGNAICSDGTYVGDNTFTIDACVTVILKVVVDAEILVPSYGYCNIPTLTDFSQEVCQGVFDLPLYPTNTNV